MAQIAKRLALIATAGDSSEAATAAVLSVEGTSLDARGDALAVATEAAGQLTAVAGEPARTPFNARSAADAASPLGLASRRASALAQLGSEPSLAANAGTETRMPGQRQSALADVLPSALAREGVVAQALSDSRFDGRGEERPEGLTGLNHAVRGSSMPAASALPAQGSLTASLYSPAWPTQLGQQLVMLGQRGGEQRVELHLNPAELGPLTISLKVSEQGAQAQFLSAHAPVRQALEQAIPQLREALAEQGISLGQTSVGEHRQQGQGDQQASAGHPGMTGPATGIDENDPVGTGTALNAPQEAGRVDLYA
ncbi:MAG: flagellar hook-length control protein FliK [Halomonas sp.]|uniref:flagellar hook-length control protein FliK n=1 Tax=Halomonas sp. TaxID=1486246 RepID=UPI00397100FE